MNCGVRWCNEVELHDRLTLHIGLARASQDFDQPGPSRLIGDNFACQSHIVEQTGSCILLVSRGPYN